MVSKLEFFYQKTRGIKEYINPHKHSCYELVYYTKGSGVSKIENQVISYSPNTYTLICPYGLHDEHHFESTQVYFIGFKYIGDEMNLKNGLYFDDSNNTILSYITKIKKEMMSQNKYYTHKVDILIQEMLIDSERILSSAKTKYGDFTYITQFIKENFNQSIDFHFLAKLSGYSYHHFRHLFKDKTGLSPINYVIQERINNAKKLISETNYTMSVISQESGFSNESQFSNIFKRIVGKTPSDYSKSN